MTVILFFCHLKCIYTPSHRSPNSISIFQIKHCCVQTKPNKSVHLVKVKHIWLCRLSFLISLPSLLCFGHQLWGLKGSLCWNFFHHRVCYSLLLLRAPFLSAAVGTGEKWEMKQEASWVDCSTPSPQLVLYKCTQHFSGAAQRQRIDQCLQISDKLIWGCSW